MLRMVETTMENDSDVCEDIPKTTTVFGLKLDNELRRSPINNDNCWSKLDAQMNYMSTPPVCFTILGKPGLGEKALGDSIAKFWNCIHINPDDVMQEQINLGSDVGRCLKFNLRCGNVITIDIILKLIEETIYSDVVKHRGYVLSGLPLVETYHSSDCCGLLYSEAAVVIAEDLMIEVLLNIDVDKYIDVVGEGVDEDLDKVSNDEELQEREAVRSVEYKTKLSGIIDIDPYFICCRRVSINEQLNTITEFKIPPTVIINISCPEKDIVALRGQNVFIYPNCDVVQLPFEIETTLKNVTQYRCYKPSDFSHLVENQFKKMNNKFQAVLKRFILRYDQQYVIRLDGRRSAYNNFEIVKTRISLLPLYRAQVPVLFQGFQEIDEETGDAVYVNVSEISSKQFLEMFAEKQMLIPRFAYTESLWGTKCPVALREGKCVTGSTKNAVILFNHVFLLSTEDALTSFCKNPRPYILNEHLTPTCRIVLMGAPKSGKTTLAKCLSWLFGAEVIDFQRIVQKLINEKEMIIRKQAYDEVLAISTERNLEIYTQKENHRLFLLEEWKQEQITMLEKYAEFDETELAALLVFTPFTTPETSKQSLSRSSKTKSRKSVTIKDGKSYPGKSPSVNVRWVVKNFIGKTVEVPEFLESCQNILSEPDMLIQFAPEHLLTPTILEEPLEEDIIRDANVLIGQENRFEDIAMTMEEVSNIVLERIHRIDGSSHQEPKKFGRWIIDGFPCEPFYWEELARHDCLPDDVFSLTENTNMDQEDYFRYKSRRRNPKSLTGMFDHLMEPLLENLQKPPEYQSKSSIYSTITKMITVLLEKDYFEENKLQTPLPDMTAESFEAIRKAEFESFLKEVGKFDEEFKVIKEFLDDIHIESINIIIPSVWSPSELIAECLRLLRYRYGVSCKESKPNVKDVTEMEGEDPVNKYDQIFFGISGQYCPVTLYKHFVNWRGREDFACEYKEKTYFMLNAEAKEDFMRDPDHFLYAEIPIENIPPWRICVAGPFGSGRSTVSKLLAGTMGLIYVDFCNFAFSSLLQSAQKNCRDHFNWLDEPGISKLTSETISPEDLEILTHLKNYFSDNSPLPSELLSSILSILWFKEPFCKTGIVLDGFPRLPSELDTIKTYFYIPDLIMELRTGYSDIHKRLFNISVENWKAQQKNRRIEYVIEKKNVLSKRESDMHEMCIALQIYLELESAAMELMRSPPGESISGESYIPYEEEEEQQHEHNETLEDINMIDMQMSQSVATIPYVPSFGCEESRRTVGTRSVFSSWSRSTVLSLFIIPDDDMAYINNIVENAFPIPEFGEEWENEENARDRIKSRIAEWYESDMNVLPELQESCEAELIPWFQVDSNRKVERIMKVVYRYISEKKSRSQSFFEQTMVIEMNAIEPLLSSGFYFMSKFGCSCPVRVFEDDSVVQMHLQDLKKNNIFPVLHRSYVYFCSGQENCLKFCDDPLKYIFSNKIDNVVYFPIGIAVTGLPKSGKTSLSKRFQEEFGFAIWTRGQSIRLVLKDFSWTSISEQIHSLLVRGQTLPNKLIAEALQIVTKDITSLTHGFIFDGFPRRIAECMYLTESEIFPVVIINMASRNDIGLEYLHTDPEYFNSMPRFSDKYISHMINKCSDPFRFFLVSIFHCYQNLTSIDASWSKWHCWWEAKKFFYFSVSDIVRFLINISETVIPLRSLCITREEFFEHASQIRDYCATCLYNGILTRSGEYLDRRGVVQWQRMFYWFCLSHIEDFLKSPYAINISLPVHVPIQIFDLKCKEVYENGRCIVTFSDNFPTRKIVPGKLDFAAIYRDKIYLCADETCFNKFMAEPEKYCDKKIHYEPDVLLPIVDVSHLPDLGYLEQALSDIVIKATVYTSKIRPKYPGLTPSVSSAILFALYLKLNNPNGSPDSLELYTKIRDDFDKKCGKVQEILDIMRVNDNPLLDLPICCTTSDVYSEFSSMSSDIVSIPTRHYSSFANLDQAESIPE